MKNLKSEIEKILLEGLNAYYASEASPYNSLTKKLLRLFSEYVSGMEAMKEIKHDGGDNTCGDCARNDLRVEILAELKKLME